MIDTKYCPLFGFFLREFSIACCPSFRLTWFSLLWFNVVQILNISTFSFSCTGNNFFHIHDSGKKTGLVNLSIKRIWKVIYTYWGIVRYDFVCFFISATWVHPSSYIRNGCHLSSKIWDGENCCICSVDSSANRTSCWPGCCSCSLPHKGISLPGILFDF